MNLNIEPQPWKRPKTRVVKGWVKHYSPQETKEYEELVATMYKAKSHGVYWEAHEPIGMFIWFGLPIPKSTSKKRARQMTLGEVKHTKRPDVDNLVKAVLDGLNGVAWEDDSQITTLNIRKCYCEAPYIWLHIYDDVN